jgi:transposase-like protein
LAFSHRAGRRIVPAEIESACRAIDKDGAPLDFYLADRCNAKAAKRFLSAAFEIRPSCDTTGSLKR